jgi:hypothetical protein
MRSFENIFVSEHERASENMGFYGIMMGTELYPQSTWLGHVLVMCDSVPD